jgi:hypothetical protein
MLVGVGGFGLVEVGKCIGCKVEVDVFIGSVGKVKRVVVCVKGDMTTSSCIFYTLKIC